MDYNTKWLEEWVLLSKVLVRVSDLKWINVGVCSVLIGLYEYYRNKKVSS